MYEEIKQALLNKGFPEDQADRIAEILYDHGWEEIRDVLNTL